MNQFQLYFFCINTDKLTYGREPLLRPYFVRTGRGASHQGEAGWFEINMGVGESPQARDVI